MEYLVGGNKFTNCSIPLVVEGRCFIVEPGLRISVVLGSGSEPVFEVLRNEPMSQGGAQATKNPTGIITVSDKTSGRFLYKIRPDSETSITFGTRQGRGKGGQNHRSTDSHRDDRPPE